MKASRETKRLFVGGLSQAISKTDLQNQFSRFGEVSDVEIITRKDDQGNAQKVFAYVNIRVAEADLKKCMSILNKTKWKGGTLQIQLAKESFLHRLAQEREEAKARKEKSTTGNTNWLGTVGGVDFHMKAVPGTEVPGHKNWVVSKFGRVLPVLHLKNQHKHKIMKYDPSKYCHNLKKIGEDFTDTVPVTSLTWKLEGGDDPMSKKRRGEFADFHGPPKKIRTVQKFQGSTVHPRTNGAVENNGSPQQRAAQKAPPNSITFPKSHPIPDSDAQKPKNIPCQTSGLETVRKINSMSDDDIDSEDELRIMIAKEEKLQRSSRSSIRESENDAFEVVRDDFKPEVHKRHSASSQCMNDVSHNVSDNIMGSDCEYDSGDTDEIIAMNKNSGKVKNSTEFSQTEKPTHKNSFKKKELSNHCNKVQRNKNSQESALRHAVKPLNHKSPSGSSSSDSEESEGDEEYETMIKNCPRVNLTLADLEELAASNLEAPEAAEGRDPQSKTTCQLNGASKTPRGSYPGKQCICPEEILASLLKEENTYGKQKPKEDENKPKFQAFKGIGCLYRKESVKKTLNVASNNISEKQSPLKHGDSNSVSLENGLPRANGSPSTLTAWQHTKKMNGPNHIQPQRQFVHETRDHKVLSPSSSDKEGGNLVSSLLPLKGKKSLSLGSKIHKVGFDEDSCHGTQQREESSEEEESDSSGLTAPGDPPRRSPREDPRESTADFSLSVSNSSGMAAQAKPAEDNQKRLAAVEARQKAKEAQKKLVHNALANLDGPPQDRSTHIVFGSDSENEIEETSMQEQNLPGEQLIKEPMAKASGKLFDSDEDKESDSEDDGDRFRIKPQFEGRAGQKLMDLQLHFGSDDRFRMDSRFLESDSEEEQEEVNEKTAEEEELASEKKKALNVMQNVLNINVNNTTSKGPVAAKKFKDIIHYDPTRHDHVTYERTKDEKPKESKAKRKKKGRKLRSYLKYLKICIITLLRI